MPHEVFISYAKEDGPTADAVCASLESSDIGCWIAPRDIGGGSYAAAINLAIKTSKVMVLVLSSDANKSGMVMREVERAANKGIPICPLEIEEHLVLSEELEFFISSQQTLHGSGRPMEENLKQLAHNVRQLLTGKGPPPKSATRYKYDVFISFSAEDFAWAKKLAESLRAAGIQSFYDGHRFLPLGAWDSEIMDSLGNSQHLIVLWSNKAKDSDWVRREVASFMTILDAYKAGQRPRRRCLISVLLEGEPPALALQVIGAIKESGCYDLGIEGVDQSIWAEVIERLVEAIKDEDRRSPYLNV